MTIPTPARLADALLDLGGGYAEIITPADPALGNHIRTMANRIPDRVRPDDPRLHLFEGHADATGYVWLNIDPRAFLIQAMNESWSFERWLTTLAEKVAESEPLTPDKLALLAAKRAEGDRMTINARDLSCQGLANTDPDTHTFHSIPINGYLDEMARRSENHVFGCDAVGHIPGQGAK